MRRFSIVAAVWVAFSLVAVMDTGTAVAASGLTPWWHITSGSRPANLPPAHEDVGRVVPGEGEVVVTVANLGDATASFRSSTNPVHIVDTLPANLRATGVVGIIPVGLNTAGVLPCSVESQSRVSCEFLGGPLGGGLGGKGLVEAINGLPPGNVIEVRVQVQVQPGASPMGEENEVNVFGGEGLACENEEETPYHCKEAPTGPISSASFKRSLRVSSEPTRFGVEDYELTPVSTGGTLDTQAGSHPFQVTFTDTMNQGADSTIGAIGDYRPEVSPAGLTKDLRFKLPPGLVGNPTPIPQCALFKFLKQECLAQAAVGIAIVAVQTVSLAGYVVFKVPVFNLEPSYGEPARFGFYLGAADLGVYIDTTVPAGGDYPVISNVENIAQTAGYLWSEVTFWGTPDAVSHNSLRGYGCLSDTEGQSDPCVSSEVKNPPPFLDLPTSCTGPLQTSLEADPWSEPGHFTTPLFAPETPSLDGCNRLQFAPEIKVTPDSQEAAKPTGLNVDVHVPQEGQLNGEGFAQSNVKDITVKLPPGVAINPSSGDGLQACSSDASLLGADVLGSADDQIGYEGGREFNSVTEPGLKLPAFTRYVPGSFGALGNGFGELLQPGVDFCPDGSKVATVTIKTPLLPHPLVGAAYLAAQEANPFDSVLAIYLVAEDPVSGSLVKLPGEVQLCKAAGEVIAGMTCEVLGQLISTFEENPQLPFEDAELHFFGGERAPLATPSRCGTYTTEAVYAPWSGSAPVRSTTSFEINAGPNHTRCVYAGEALPFSPTLTGGGLSVNAGWFSPFDATFSRLPGEQNMQSIEVHLPPGLSAILSNVELCPEPQANLGECGPNSLIGETTVGVGVGGEPYTVSGGKFYLTGPYNGKGACTVGEAGCAPFGITFVVPAKAGPYDFADTKNNHPACDCVLVRGKIEVNPITAAVTITSNPPGLPDSIPTSIEGIPLEVQHVNAITTRNDFQFNPTNCDRMEVASTIHSSEGAADVVSVPFQVTNCAVLAFKPSFEVSTSGKTSRADGTSLSVKLTYPKAPFGTQANIKSVKVDLPKQLPSRLTTLQKACTAKQFETNPAGCPGASIVGHATAVTPLIPVPLTGPAYFVSYGGAKFPELVIVLQGYGVTLDVHGETFISKAGITSSTFHTIPDAPVGSFELNLPEGPYSALAANGNLCKSKLVMPTAFVAQNGAEIHESTKISVTGCAKAAKTKKSKHKKKSRAKTKAKK
jgi:hypothetical protein